MRGARFQSTIQLQRLQFFRVFRGFPWLINKSINVCQSVSGRGCIEEMAPDVLGTQEGVYPHRLDSDPRSLGVRRTRW